MRKIFLSLLTLITALGLAAQESWQIPGYSGRTVISLQQNDNVLNVQMGDTIKSFPVQKTARGLEMTPEDGEALLVLIRLDAARINAKYAQYGNEYSATEKLLRRIQELQGRAMALEALGAATTVGEEGGVTMPPEITTPETEKRGSGISWIWVPLALIAGAAAGYFMRRSPEEPEYDLPDEEALPAEKITKRAAKPENAKQLQAKLKEAMNANRQLKESLNEVTFRLKENERFDRQVYQSLWQKMLLPMQDALEKGDKRGYVEQLVKLGAHAASITRFKLARKLDFDANNIAYLSEGKVDSKFSTRQITGQTPLDSIPNQLAPVIDLLKENHSRGLDETIISGYKIKDL